MAPGRVGAPGCAPVVGRPAPVRDPANPDAPRADVPMPGRLYDRRSSRGDSSGGYGRRPDRLRRDRSGRAGGSRIRPFEDPSWTARASTKSGHRRVGRGRHGPSPSCSPTSPGAVALHIPRNPATFDRTAAGGTAVVVDLPGLESIGLGLELARLGYPAGAPVQRLPGPRNSSAEACREVVPSDAVALGTLRGKRPDQIGRICRSTPLPPSCSTRTASDRSTDLPGWFDNRWVVFATDFPSSDFLNLQRITGVQVVHQARCPGISSTSCGYGNAARSPCLTSTCTRQVVLPTP